MVTQHTFRHIQYLLQYPADYQPTRTYPLLIFMHGAGTRGDDIQKVRENPFFTLIQQHNDFPFIVAAPLCAADTWFDVLETVNDFARHISAQATVDAERVYLMGASMGGYAVWQMAMSNPALYAAIVPICGGGMAWNAPRLANVPVWAFHGDSDPVVNPAESRRMVDGVLACGGDAKLTVYENCGHDAWSPTYSNMEVFRWLLQHKRLGGSVADRAFDDSKTYG